MQNSWNNNNNNININIIIVRQLATYACKIVIKKNSKNIQETPVAGS